MSTPDRVNIFGTQISITDLRTTIDWIISNAKHSSGYICLTDSYVIVKAHSNQKLQDILNNSLLTLPDGSPLVSYARRKGTKGIGSVSGYWLVKALVTTQLTHFFYGSSEVELIKISERINEEFPSSRVLGYMAPPWLELNEIEANAAITGDMKRIQILNPDIIWVGLNSPKQDYLMSFFSHDQEGTIMIGIGGVFDYLSGKTKISPEWIKKISLRWLYRLIQDPRRFWRKAIAAIIGFLKLIVLELWADSIKWIRYLAKRK